MDLGGNLKERVVTIGNSTGLLFTGSEGTGVLNTTTGYEGNANNTGWPGMDAQPQNGVDGAAGSGFRGGSWADSANYLRTSDRTEAALTSTAALNTYGGRGVRTYDGKLKDILLFCYFMCMAASTAWASNLQLSNLDEVSANTAAGTMTFSFNLTQDNSWRNQTNYDAVWVFMKYSTDGGATWHHASMAGSGINPPGFPSLPNSRVNLRSWSPRTKKDFLCKGRARPQEALL